MCRSAPCRLKLPTASVGKKLSRVMVRKPVGEHATQTMQLSCEGLSHLLRLCTRAFSALYWVVAPMHM